MLSFSKLVYQLRMPNQNVASLETRDAVILCRCAQGAPFLRSGVRRLPRGHGYSPRRDVYLMTCPDVFKACKSSSCIVLSLSYEFSNLSNLLCTQPQNVRWLAWKTESIGRTRRLPCSLPTTRHPRKKIGDIAFLQRMYRVLTQIGVRSARDVCSACLSLDCIVLLTRSDGLTPYIRYS